MRTVSDSQGSPQRPTSVDYKVVVLNRKEMLGTQNSTLTILGGTVIKFLWNMIRFAWNLTIQFESQRQKMLNLLFQTAYNDSLEHAKLACRQFLLDWTHSRSPFPWWCMSHSFFKCGRMK